jgi:hypothetical protein
MERGRRIKNITKYKIGEGEGRIRRDKKETRNI